MSLLEKALRGAKAAEGPGGLFAKAAAAKAQAVAPTSLLEEGPELGLAAELAFSPPEFPLSTADLKLLEMELLSLNDSPDYLLAVFARITEALPIEALALFLPYGDGFALAASLGFPAATAEFVPESAARRAGPPGAVLSDESAATISSLLGVSPTLRLRGATLAAAGAPLTGQWVFTDGVLEYADAETIAALGRLLAAPGGRDAPALALLDPSPSPGHELAAQAHDQRYAIAISLDLKSTYIELDLRVPGILPTAFFSLLTASARRVLGRNGAAAFTEAGFLVCLFFSSTALDPDLTLFQFRKSLKRSLPLLESVELSVGRSAFFDLGEGEAVASLSRFLAE